MIGELIDMFAGAVSPAWGAKRSHARRIYDHVSQRSYDAAKKNRTNSNWQTTNKSADLSLLSNADVIRARARDLVRNNAYAAGIVRTLVRNVVGTGIKPQSMVEHGSRRRSDEPDEKFNQSAERLWARWQKQADVTGRLSFYEIQRLALREVHEAGEILVHYVNSENRSRVLPFALELIEADRLADDYAFPRNINTETGNEVRRGVEINASGEPVAYWIYPRHPNDLNTLMTRPVRHDASEFVHLFKQDRIGQTRGVSSFAPVIRWLKDLHFYLENELQSSAVASCFSVAVKTVDGGAGGGIGDEIDTDSTDADGNTFEYIQPGMVARLLPDEEIEVINPTRQNSASGDWIQLMLRSVAVGAGLSYERLARDYSQTNFSSNRASDLEDRREFRPEQDWMITHLCEPVWNRFVTSAVMSGAEGFPSETQLLFDYEKWTSHRWQPPGWEWVDPQKEAKASEIALASNLSTLSDELGVRGKDVREVLAQRAREKKWLKDLGLTASPEEEKQQQQQEKETVNAEE